jgi:hypothetical protein
MERNSNLGQEDGMEAKITSVQYGSVSGKRGINMDSLTESIVRIMVGVGLGAVGIVFVGIIIIGG